jgi:hypothetical protein
MAWVRSTKYMPIARPRVARFTRVIPQSASAAFHVLYAKFCLSKYHHETKLWASQNIFPDSIHNIFSEYGHILHVGKTLCSGPRRRPSRQAHGSTSLSPRHHVWCPWDFLGLVNTSRTSLVRDNERYLAFRPAVPRAFLEISDLRTQSGSFYL